MGGGGGGMCMLWGKGDKSEILIYITTCHVQSISKSLIKPSFPPSIPLPSLYISPHSFLPTQNLTIRQEMQRHETRKSTPCREKRDKREEKKIRKKIEGVSITAFPSFPFSHPNETPPLFYRFIHFPPLDA